MTKGVFEATRQKHVKKITEMQQELVQTVKKVDQLTQRQEDIDSETTLAKKRIAEQQKYQKEIEERDVRLNGEYIQLLEKKNSGT